MKKILAGLAALIALCTAGNAAAEKNRPSSAGSAPEEPACTYRITLPSAEESALFLRKMGEALSEYGKAFAVSTEPAEDAQAGDSIVLVIGG